MADITLYNSVYDPETERTEFLKTYIHNISWEGQQAITVGDKGLLSADKITCFIPMLYETDENKIYKYPGEFSMLDSKEKSKYFTFKKGDFIVKGKVDFELSTYERGKKIENLKLLYDVGTIVSIVTNDFGSVKLQHWEIGAK